jgi:hypothetical protein
MDILPGPLQGAGPDPAVPAAYAVHPQLQSSQLSQRQLHLLLGQRMDTLPGPLLGEGPDPAVPATYAVHPQLQERPA